jgi:hypothetical protein
MPLLVYKKINIIKYWVKILKLPDNSLVKKTYIFLKSDVENGVNYRGKNWAGRVKSILETHGLGYIWDQQEFVDIPFQMIKVTTESIITEKT